MKSLELYELNREKIEIIKPLWQKLKEHHKNKTKYFMEFFEGEGFSFEKRIAEITGKTKIYVVEDKDKKIIIGYCISSTDDNNIGEIDSIYVEKEYRRQKVGDMLMRKSLDWLNEEKVLKKRIGVLYGNEEAFGFYMKYGFYPRTTILLEK